MNSAGCLLALATLVCSAAAAQEPVVPQNEIGVSASSDQTLSEDLPEIDWSRVNIDAYDLTRSAAARDMRRARDSETKPAWNRTQHLNGSANMTVNRSLPTTFDTKIGMDMFVAPSPSTFTIPGTQQQQSTSAAWASAALPSIGSWGWDQASLNARLDPNAEQGRLGTSVSKSMPLNEQWSLTLQSGIGVSQAFASSSQVLEADRLAKLSWAPSGTSLLAGSRTSSHDDRWLNSFGAEQSLFGGISVRGTVSETLTGGHDRSLTAGFRRTW